MHRFVLILAGLLLVIAGAAPAHAASCTKYVSVSGAELHDGSLGNEWTMAEANANADAGDVVCIDPDDYTTSISPANIGTETSQIIFKKDPNQTGEVVIKGTSSKKCIHVNKANEDLEENEDARKAWLRFENITCDGRPGVTCNGVRPGSGDGGLFGINYGVELIDTDHVTLVNLTIRHIGKRGISIAACNNGSNPNCSLTDPDGSDHNRVAFNTVECVGFGGGGRGIHVMNESDYNVIEGNNVLWAAHQGIQIEASEGNVISGNKVYNEWHRAISDTGADRTDPNQSGYDFGGTLIDSNWIPDFGITDSPEPGYTADLGISMHSKGAIVRRNRLHGGRPTGINMSVAGSEARLPDLSGNRIYHNTVVDNGSAGFRITDQGNSLSNVDDNVFVNNVFYGNNVDPVTDPDGTPLDETELRIKVTATDPGTQLEFASNLIRVHEPEGLADEAEVGFIEDWQNDDEQLTEKTLDDLETLGWFDGNIDDHPRFVNRADEDYRPVSSTRTGASSPLIDGGRFLTEVAAGGCSGSTITVEDASFFFAGLDTAPATWDGDTIQLEGSTTELEITGISGDVITVDQTVTCSVGDGVALAYDGSAPDIGYHEGGVSETYFVSVAAEDGYAVEASPAAGVGGSVDASDSGSTALRVGDEDDTAASTDLGLRSILSFDTSSLPSNATIIGAFLELTTSGTVGDPEGVGDFVVEIADGSFDGAAALEKEDWEASAAKSYTLAGFPSTTADDLWLIDLGELPSGALDHVDPDGTTQLRIRLTAVADDDGVDDQIRFYSAEYTDTAKRPVLSVVYTTP